MIRRVLLLSVAALSMGSIAITAHPLPQASDCPIFPADNPWNVPVDDLPVANNSDRIVESIGLDESLHADFASGLYEGSKIGIPVGIVDADQAKKRVKFYYADESDEGPYPIPRNVKIEGDPDPDPSNDRHALIVDRSDCMLYELYALRKKDGAWHAASGAIWDLNSNEPRPEGWTSADAAGLPILPGLARYSDVATGVIDHALRFTVEESRSSYVYPATHEASDSNDPDLPPMGLRLRLKADFDISEFPPQAQTVLQALKTYGMIVADNGSDWYVSGAPNKNWDNDDLHTLGDVLGQNFEVVDTSSMEH